jgi:hypothetical protein
VPLCNAHVVERLGLSCAMDTQPALQQFSQQIHCGLSRLRMFEDQNVSVCLSVCLCQAVCPYWHFGTGCSVARLMVTFSIKMAVKFCTHVGTAINPQELSSMFFPGGRLRRSCEVRPFASTLRGPKLSK